MEWHPIHHSASQERVRPSAHEVSGQGGEKRGSAIHRRRTPTQDAESLGFLRGGSAGSLKKGGASPGSAVTCPKEARAGRLCPAADLDSPLGQGCQQGLGARRGRLPTTGRSLLAPRGPPRAAKGPEPLFAVPAPSCLARLHHSLLIKRFLLPSSPTRRRSPSSGCGVGPSRAAPTPRAAAHAPARPGPARPWDRASHIRLSLRWGGPWSQRAGSPGVRAGARRWALEWGARFGVEAQSR